MIVVTDGSEMPRYAKTKTLPAGMHVMRSNPRNWLEYDPVALVVLSIGIVVVGLIVLSI